MTPFALSGEAIVLGMSPEDREALGLDERDGERVAWLAFALGWAEAGGRLRFKAYPDENDDEYSYVFLETAAVSELPIFVAVFPPSNRSLQGQISDWLRRFSKDLPAEASRAFDLVHWAPGEPGRVLHDRDEREID